MDTNDLRFILEELHFSAALPAEMLEQIAAASSLRTVPIGEIVFREGSISDSLYLVSHGRLALEINVPKRGAVRILTVGAGELAGWSALIGERKMTTSAIAVAESDLVVTSAKKLHKLCEANSEFGYLLMHRMAKAVSNRLVATRLQLLDLFADTSPDIDLGSDS